MVGAQLAGPGHERADVLGQTPAAKAEAGVEETTPDPRVISQRVGQQGDVGVDGLAHLGDRVDERDRGGEKGVRGHLDQFGGLKVGDQERHALFEQRGVELTDRDLGSDRIPLHAEHNAVGVQRVVDGEALAQEFGVPRHLDVDTLGCKAAGPVRELGGRADGHR